MQHPRRRRVGEFEGCADQRAAIKWTCVGNPRVSRATTTSCRAGCPGSSYSWCSMREPAKSTCDDAERSQTTRRISTHQGTSRCCDTHLQNRVGVDIEQRRLGAKKVDAIGQVLVFGLPRQMQKNCLFQEHDPATPRAGSMRADGSRMEAGHASHGRAPPCAHIRSV